MLGVFTFISFILFKTITKINIVKKIENNFPLAIWEFKYWNEREVYEIETK